VVLGRKCVGFRELKLRQIEIKVRVAFWGDSFFTKLLFPVY